MINSHLLDKIDKRRVFLAIHLVDHQTVDIPERVSDYIFVEYVSLDNLH